MHLWQKIIKPTAFYQYYIVLITGLSTQKKDVNPAFYAPFCPIDIIC